MAKTEAYYTRFLAIANLSSAHGQSAVKAVIKKIMSRKGFGLPSVIDHNIDDFKLFFKIRKVNIFKKI